MDSVVAIRNRRWLKGFLRMPKSFEGNVGAQVIVFLSHHVKGVSGKANFSVRDDRFTVCLLFCSRNSVTPSHLKQKFLIFPLSMIMIVKHVLILIQVQSMIFAEAVRIGSELLGEHV